MADDDHCARCPGRRGESLAAEARRATTATTGDDGLVRLPTAQADRRLKVLRALLADAAGDDAPETAVLGRRVRLRDAEGAGDTATYALVVPGDGDPSQGWISVDSPRGAAVLGRRTGDRVEVASPAGRWFVTIVAVE
jgi:transcription elongation GreA/GreB family factor